MSLPKLPVISDAIEALKEMPTETRLFINGEFVPSRSGKTFDVFNPATEQKTASVFEADVEDVNDAVAAAKAAFPAWSDLAATERGAFLFKLADSMEKHFAEMSYLDAVSMGKPVDSDAVAMSQLRYYAGKASDIQGDSSLNTPGMLNIVLRQPFGVCGAITPWNAPITMVVQKLGPALIAGNTLVLKSSEKAPLSPLVLAKCCQEIGLPKGVLNILNGFGRPCGEAIARHMDIRKISFTGSTSTGRAIKKAAAEVMKEEIFGPVMCINSFDDEEAVLGRANDTNYGLYASVYTRDISRALRIAKRFEAGNVGINCTSPTMTADMPFGGWKESGEGKEGSKYATDYWTELKSVYVAL
ncbi:aldehyde dehydrogenase [Colletotrichum camelliae]|nr:aldehyde dehydrogenase [Colletotrichum camelliae]